MTLQSKSDCLSHERADPLVELFKGRASELTLGEMLDKAKDHFGHEDVALRLDRTIVTGLTCWNCVETEEWVGPIFRLTPEQVPCAKCGQLREVHKEDHIDNSSNLLDLSLTQVGIPPGHIIRARFGDNNCYFELTGDFPAALTPNLIRKG